MNTYKLQIENGNDRILKIIKNIAEELGAKIKIITNEKSKLTINGYTKEFEDEILKISKEHKELLKAGKAAVYDSEEKIKNHLKNDYKVL